MAPNSRLEEKLRKLGLSKDDDATSRSSPACKAKHFFRIYFPLPPYDGLQFNALRSGSGFNFTGQLLGIGGKQLQRIKQESSARVEVVNAQGNLNGSHPDPLDPDLHALIQADSVCKLQKAADMVWDLLQPVNAKYEPIDVRPGGSVRLTIAQSDKASKTGGMATPSSAATPKAAERSKGGGKSKVDRQAPAADSHSQSTSPAMTPVTPAAANSSVGAFTADYSTTGSNKQCHSSSASGNIGNACGSTDSYANSSRTGSPRKSSSSIQVKLFSTQSDMVTLPPAGVQQVAVESAAKYLSGGPAELHVSMQTAEQRQETPTAADAVAVVSRLGNTVQVDSQQVQNAELVCNLQPPTPTAGQAAAAAVSDTVDLQLTAAQPGSRTSLDSVLIQDLSIGSDEAIARTAQNTCTGTAAVSSDVTSDPVVKGPLAALRIEHKQHDDSAILGPEANSSSCFSCFQYGLGLCNSSSWDSPLSCSSPALQALLADHQRQQQVEQMQLTQGTFGGPLAPPAFEDASFGHSSLPSCGLPPCTFPHDNFSLGPPALVHSNVPLITYSRVDPSVPERLAGTRFAAFEAGSQYQQQHAQRAGQHSNNEMPSAAGGLQLQSVGFAAVGQGWQHHNTTAPGHVGMHWGMHISSSAAISLPFSASGNGYATEPGYTSFGATAGFTPGASAWGQTQQEGGLFVLGQQQQYSEPWQAGCGLSSSAFGCNSYDQAHALSSSIW